jgi:hypothetical protein
MGAVLKVSALAERPDKRPTPAKEAPIKVWRKLRRDREDVAIVIIVDREIEYVRFSLHRIAWLSNNKCLLIEY